jgi:hypothetical protein
MKTKKTCACAGKLRKVAGSKIVGHSRLACWRVFREVR